MQMKQREYNSGEVVIREGDRADCAYIIERGRVKVSRSAPGGSVVLAELGAGELVGEMGIISEKPRSASVIALEPCVLRVIEQHDLLDTLQSDRETAIKLLRVLFDRLRQADARLSQLEQPQSSRVPWRGKLVALTAEAEKALGAQQKLIEALPCRIGRANDDPLSLNDIALQDEKPYKISRHHLVVLEENGKAAIYDRGSSLGSWVAGQPLGGPSSFEGPVIAGKESVEIILGNAESAMQFRLEEIV